MMKQKQGNIRVGDDDSRMGMYAGDGAGMEAGLPFDGLSGDEKSPARWPGGWMQEMEDGTRNKRERKLGRGRARGRVRGGFTWRTGDGVAAPTAGQASHPPPFPVSRSGLAPLAVFVHEEPPRRKVLAPHRRHQYSVD
uniref:Uncharacterized protein n=1 Tax=Coccidioides posadasii RMSCC 3488 TaxID=454284 RepID=A0A0J6FE74_COCPO|nr:hypothetical protein CPAG_03533 [Coccidioides posadasii RMSCC 3488]